MQLNDAMNWYVDSGASAHMTMHKEWLENIINLAVSDEECQRLLDADNVAFFVDNVHAETAEAKRALRDAEERRDELLRVERAIAEVHDLFVQVAHLVAAQQDQLDSVEFYALQATEHVDSGQQQLLKGSVTRKRTQQKKWGLIMCLVAGGSVVLLVLIFT
ncbi:syntaxin-4-like [Hyposmocoma kahamanoa]|uniref:syntaxin-4-like n=1 Tax=Hyposmocoma kahamanoa TaxID=1477025 RepID=UPI000E6D8461|nr:syntaxin-4-like [Hyposmocoma kahamanoa]